MSNRNVNDCLECEKWWIFAVMMLVGGFYGAYTYSVRGGVFCNAQTANFVLFAMAIGNTNWSSAWYYLIPMSAYLLGAFLSEFYAKKIKKFGIIRWDTALVAFEVVTVISLGFVPETAPYQITHVIINLVCSMQYNTFRQAQGLPMATTFCTNHIRQVGVAFCKVLRHKNESKKYLETMFAHVSMLCVFIAGGIAATVLCRFFSGRAIWFTLIPLIVVLADFLYADLKKEKGKLDLIPQGH